MPSAIARYASPPPKDKTADSSPFPANKSVSLQRINAGIDKIIKNKNQETSSAKSFLKDLKEKRNKEVTV